MERRGCTDGQRWGRWVYRQGERVLRIEGPLPDRYDVDLDRCQDQVEVLDWIVHVAEKTWITAEDVGNLVKALDECLGVRQLPRTPEDAERASGR